MPLPRLRLPRWATPSRPGRHRLLTALVVIVIGIGGALLGIALGGHTDHEVGPVEATFSLQPSLRGDTLVEIPPLGSLAVDSHDGPARLDIRLDRLNEADATRLVKHPDEISGIADRAAHDVISAVEQLALRAGLCALGGALLVGFVVFRDWRRALLSGGVAVVVVAATGASAVLTWNQEALREPTYSGLLTNAPALVGSAENIEKNFSIYQQELAGLVTNVSKLYTAASTLPAYQPGNDTLRVLHVSDLHLNPAAWSVMHSVVAQYKIQVIVDTGDLTDHGSAAENRFVDQISTFDIPYIYVKGNHDSTTTVAAVKRQPNAIVLDNTEVTVDGLTFAGIGDPLFTPDKKTHTEDTPADELLQQAGEQLASSVQNFKRPPDVLLVHNPKMAEPLAGVAPLVLAGHLHRREVKHLPDGTLLLVEGSTGGAGLRALDHKEPTPLECSVLYFDANSLLLQARDDITLGGLGESKVTIDRTVVQHPDNDSDNDSAQPR